MRCRASNCDADVQAQFTREMRPIKHVTQRWTTTRQAVHSANDTTLTALHRPGHHCCLQRTLIVTMQAQGNMPPLTAAVCHYLNVP